MYPREERKGKHLLKSKNKGTLIEKTSFSGKITYSEGVPEWDGYRKKMWRKKTLELFH